MGTTTLRHDLDPLQWSSHSGCLPSIIRHILKLGEAVAGQQNAVVGRLQTIGAFWSVLRSWLRPHRGISQDKLPLYLGFSSSCTTLAYAAKPSSTPLSEAWLHDGPTATPEPTKSHLLLRVP